MHFLLGRFRYFSHLTIIDFIAIMYVYCYFIFRWMRALFENKKKWTRPIVKLFDNLDLYSALRYKIQTPDIIYSFSPCGPTVGLFKTAWMCASNSVFQASFVDCRPFLKPAVKTVLSGSSPTISIWQSKQEPNPPSPSPCVSACRSAGLKQSASQCTRLSSDGLLLTPNWSHSRHSSQLDEHGVHLKACWSSFRRITCLFV